MNQHPTIKYPYKIKFTYNNTVYTHEFCEIVNWDIEKTASTKHISKSYLGVAVGGINDKFSSLKQELDIYEDQFVYSVSLYDGITNKEVFQTHQISLKDDGVILEESYNKPNNNK